MSSKIGVLALTVVFALFPWVAGVYAGEKSEAESKTSSNEIKIGVGGMMCDGCVAKLEKALWSSMGDSVSVKVSLGSEMAQLTCPIGKFLEVEVLQKEVTNTGFTPKDVEIKATGRLVTLKDGKPAFHVTGSKESFLLVQNDQLDKLKKRTGSQDSDIVISGRLSAIPSKNKEKESTGPPLALLIESFQIAKK